MIIGVGTDIVRISRIEKSIDRSGDKLAKRVLTISELATYRAAVNPAAYLAKRFAAKEAAAKAFGTGIGKISWHDLEIGNLDNGAPIITCRGNASELLLSLGGSSIHLSISDEEDYALAFVVISAS